ncbi:HepT-like ribonuclease domain-containing protein [Desulfobulbus alkaliphilus]|uniref:HepT-like ribonuclease domain-containing protein n=1 Tax=Desulfobulbus alkaliphilus TaxID=869814 RepID=UPI0019647312|nr:DUF86 domain-containing protein [Desulfobulbus alkaliphilus]MBM9537671.1 DUF86 domain-containing protein [Desulfobulbus alkaliphilus]
MKDQRFAQDYLRDILEAMDKAEEFTNGLDLPMFYEDDKTSFAVIRCEIIGEDARKISVEHRRRFADVPWKSLAGMRDKLIHDYAGVSLEIVWRTVKEDIPTVRPKLKVVLEKLQEEEG